ncbi:uncharacterized protein K489DRAFT_421304 [Dissoconium aciculare CBS 342.82]|uniref:Uncharacterized protein n=1 Tax=Dissoconium aciculare CBS 342.82 TaxID=1314786 RepID=A0A6J3MAM7_9PEZI|nr:uncharacterized protein K489DRAFT_421304 [Dissoconium aciculare CBS 342.82]KAF1825076.1 hypothetical protein K489DRAFT_421304 [Dissoconium aciculare CBS 342.82]
MLPRYGAILAKIVSNLLEPISRYCISHDGEGLNVTHECFSSPSSTEGQQKKDKPCASHPPFPRRFLHNPSSPHANDDRSAHHSVDGEVDTALEDSILSRKEEPQRRRKLHWLLPSNTRYLSTLHTHWLVRLDDRHQTTTVSLQGFLRRRQNVERKVQKPCPSAISISMYTCRSSCSCRVWPRLIENDIRGRIIGPNRSFLPHVHVRLLGINCRSTSDREVQVPIEEGMLQFGSLLEISADRLH